MALNTICNACQMGEHRRHDRVVQAAPEGGAGGAVCVCEGECKDKRYMPTMAELLGQRYA